MRSYHKVRHVTSKKGGTPTYNICWCSWGPRLSSLSYAVPIASTGKVWHVAREGKPFESR